MLFSKRTPLMDSRDKVPAMAGFSNYQDLTQSPPFWSLLPSKGPASRHGAAKRENSARSGQTDLSGLIPGTPASFPIRVGFIVSTGLKDFWSPLLISPFL